MYVDNIDIPLSRVGETARQVVDRAFDDAYLRRHPMVTTDHLFLAVAQAEWDTFAALMRDLDVYPQRMLQTIEERLRLTFPGDGRDIAIEPGTKLALKLALRHASRAGRQAMEAIDILAAVFDDPVGTPASLLRSYGVDPELVIARLQARDEYVEPHDTWLKKRYELPPNLEQFATNLNLLARQDKIPPAYGRDREIQQVLEVLCHRERTNSVMLIGEPGVGKTALVEGLARRIELEPDTVPVRLRGCQIINLQMNALVSGTMLRGMFEERIQHVIREVTERPQLILFVDEAHTIIGAGSALGVAGDAANIFKSALARGAVRMIAATTLDEYKQHIQDDRRSRAASAVCGSRSRRSRRRGACSPACGHASSGPTWWSSPTPPSRWRSTYRRGTCGTSACRTR